MRLRVYSDLHLEFHPDFGQAFVDRVEPDPAAVLVLAGDIITLRKLEAVERAFSTLARKFARLVYVPGNHEYYGLSTEQGRAILDALPKLSERITVLRAGTVVEHEGRRILGDTMWFPNTEEAEPWKPALTDFMAIREFEPWVYEEHRRCVEFLQAQLRAGDIVVTHHMPSPRCISWRFSNSPLNTFFVHDMTPLMTERQPAVWIHGHGHEAVDFRVGATRVVANPMGYPKERLRTVFNEGFVVEV